MNSNPAFTVSFAENPFLYQQFNLRDIRLLRGAQPNVHHDTTVNCRLYVTTMKAMYFQDDIPSSLVDNFKHHYVLQFNLTSMQDVTEHCHYPELFGEPLILKPYFSSPLENVTEVIVCLLLQSTSFVLWERIFEMDNTSLTQIVNRIPLLKYRCMGSFPSDFVLNLQNDTFAIINKQSSYTPGEHWKMIAKFHLELHFPNSLDLSINNYPFPYQNYSKMVRTRLQDHPSVCGFYTIYAAFLSFKIPQEEVTGFQDVNVLSFIIIFMW